MWTFSVGNKTLLSIIDYYSKFPVVNKANSLTTDDLVKEAKITFPKFGLSKKIIPDAGMNFTSYAVRQFGRQMNTEQAITSSYHHWSNGQVEMCIKFVKSKIKKGLDTNNDVSLAVLEIQLTVIGVGLPSAAMLFFNRPIRDILS